MLNLTDAQTIIIPHLRMCITSVFVKFSLGTRFFSVSYIVNPLSCTPQTFRRGMRLYYFHCLPKILTALPSTVKDKCKIIFWGELSKRYKFPKIRVKHSVSFTRYKPCYIPVIPWGLERCQTSFPYVTDVDWVKIHNTFV